MTQDQRWSAAIKHLQAADQKMREAGHLRSPDDGQEWWKLIPLLACMERNPILCRLYPSFNNAIVRLSNRECVGFRFNEEHTAGTFPVWCRYLPGDHTYLVTRAQKRDDFGWTSTELFRGDCVAVTDFIAEQLVATDYGKNSLTF